MNKMDLTSIFTIGGKPGLQKLVAKSASGVIVESLTDGKRFNAYSSYKISSLEDISIYGEEEDIPLREVLIKIAEGNSFEQMEIPKKGELIAALNGFITIDQERVYESDIKKLFAWYNILIKSEILTQESLKEEGEEEEKAPVAEEKKEQAPAEK
jgi:hypothetical protein